MSAIRPYIYMIRSLRNRIQIGNEMQYKLEILHTYFLFTEKQQFFRYIALQFIPCTYAMRNQLISNSGIKASAIT